MTQQHPDHDIAEEGLEHGVFRAVFQSSSDALVLVDRRGVIVMSNPAASVLFGYSAQNLIGLSVEQLIPESIRDQHVKHRANYDANRVSRPMGIQKELAARKADGSTVMVEVALSPLHDQGLPFVVAAIRDVSTYPRVTRALRRARFSEYLAHFAKLTANMRSEKDLLAHVPQLAIQALQIGHVEALRLDLPHRSIERVAHASATRPDTAPWSENSILTDAVQLAKLFQQQNAPPFVISPHTVIEEGMAFPLLGLNGISGALLAGHLSANVWGPEEMQFLESLSHIASAGIQRVQSEQALNHAQKLESVGQLTGGIAHDFNNLLTVVRGNLQILEDMPSISDDPCALRFVSAASKACQRGAELTGKLLTFSRRQVLQPRAVDADAMVRSMADLLRRMLDQRIKVKVSSFSDKLWCHADPAQLESALLNLAINARDAMPDGGHLKFELELCTELPADAQSSIAPESPPNQGYVLIRVIDTGLGMPDEVKQHVFEPFFTTKEAGRGTGLGLSTVYGFIQQSKGAIKLDSSMGKGTNVALYLPRTSDMPDTTETPAFDNDALIGSLILLVEDDPEVRNVAKIFLEDLKCEVQAVASAEQALVEIAAQGSKYALLLTDIALGSDMSGTMLASQVEDINPDIGILLTTGHAPDRITSRSNSSFRWDVLHKPYTKSELAQAILNAINQKHLERS